MLIIPFQIGETEYNIFVALNQSSIDRIVQYDPAQLIVDKLPPLFRKLRLKAVLIGYANESDMAETIRLGNQGKQQEALEFLSRGFQFRPDLGDHNGPPLSILNEKDEIKH